MRLVPGLILFSLALSSLAHAQCPRVLPVRNAAPPMPVFPTSDPWNLDIADAPVDAKSARFIAAIGRERRLGADFGGTRGIPYVVVDAKQPRVAVVFDAWRDSDGVDRGTGEGVPFYPVPREAITQRRWIEGGQAGNEPATGPGRLLMLDCRHRTLYEVSGLRYDTPMGEWAATSGAAFDLDASVRRAAGKRSADASGLAIFPGLVRVDEALDAGDADFGHALRMTVRASNGAVFPASRADGSTAGALPLGARLRLKSTVDGRDPALRTNDAVARRILRTLQRHGAIIADHGDDLQLSGTLDDRWNSAALDRALGTVQAGDFEVVQLGWNPASASREESPVGPSALPTLSVNDSHWEEGDNDWTLAMAAILSAPSSQPVTFDLSTADGTAHAPGDYAATTLTGLAIPAGQTYVDFYIKVEGDGVVEPNETFVVNLTNVNGAIADPQAVVTLINDDGPVLSISGAGNYEGQAGTRTLTFTVRLSKPNNAGPVTYDIATAPYSGANAATAGGDYTAKSLMGESIPAGMTSKTFTVDIKGDTTVEPDEKLSVFLTNASVSTYFDEGVGTIYDDDGVTISIEDAVVDEAAGVARVYVRLSKSLSHTVTFDLATAAGTATATADFAPVSANNASIPLVDTFRMFQIDIAGDNAIETDETFFVRLSDVQGATVADGEAVVRIVNDDFPRLAIGADVGTLESDTGTKTLGWTLKLSEPAPFPVTFDIGTTGKGTATAGVDYAPLAVSNQSFAPGQTHKTYLVTIQNDDVIEPDETFVIAVADVANARVIDGHALGTIINDDKPMLSIADATINEADAGTKKAVFKITLSEPAPYPVYFVHQMTGAGTATAAVDYVVRNPENHVLPIGATSMTLAVTVVADSDPEPNETFVMTLQSPFGATLADGSALGTITNDD
jgi:hypothetical protein